MEEQEEPSAQFVKGFNAGYQIQKHEPELLDKIIKSDNDSNEYIQAMKSGRKQRQKEVMVQEQKDALEKQKLTHRPKH